MRFAHAVSNSFIAEYASRLPDMGSIVHAYIEAGAIRAVAELRRLGAELGPDAESAFSVEQAWQNCGIGNELMGRFIRCARNRGVQRLLMGCLAENHKIQALARRHDAELSYQQGDVLCVIAPGEPTFLSHVEKRFGHELDF